MDDELSLKEVEAEDGLLLADLFAYPLSIEKADILAAALANDSHVHMLIVVNGQVAGIVEMHDGEVGYRIKKAYRNRGIATKALALFLAQGLYRTAKAKVEEGNAASCRVLAGNGFVKVKEEEGICHFIWEK